MAGLIAATRDMEWTAVKITQFGHGICSQHAEPCSCSLIDTEHTWSLDEEHEVKGKTDTSRYLGSGANRSFWLRTQIGKLAEAMPAVRRIIQSTKNVILESNSVMQFLRPDLYISVLAPQTKDFKPSALKYLDRADAVVMNSPSGQGGTRPLWQGVSRKLYAEKPVFHITPPDYVSTPLVDFVLAHLNVPEAKVPQI